MRNALLTASKMSPVHGKIDIHLSDDSDIIIARNLLITHILLDDNFHPTDLADLNYIWHVWYSTQVTAFKFRY